MYRVFRPVDKHLSPLMLAPLLARIPIVLVLEVCNLAAIMILKSPTRPTLDIAQQQEISFLLLKLHGYRVGTTKIFFGLGFIPFGMLVLRSGLIPRVFGYLLIISGIAYVTDSVSYILLQRPDYLVIHEIVRYSSVGYLLVFLWLLIMGVREPRATAAAQLNL